MNSFSFLETCFALVSAAEKQTTHPTCCHLDSFFLMGKLKTMPLAAQLSKLLEAICFRCCSGTYPARGKSAGAEEHPTTWVQGWGQPAMLMSWMRGWILPGPGAPGSLSEGVAAPWRLNRNYDAICLPAQGSPNWCCLQAMGGSTQSAEARVHEERATWKGEDEITFLKCLFLTK